MPARVKVQWHGRQFLARYRATSAARVQREMTTVTQQLRARVGTPYPPASRPGRPPHRRTGRLQKSINSNVVVSGNKLTATAFATARHAPFLQRGTSRIAARPFLFLLRSQTARLMAALRF